MSVQKDQIKIAVAQVQAKSGDSSPEMLDDALSYIEQAGNAGADLLLFPEMYPGPSVHKDRFEVVEPLCEAARRAGIAVAAGTSVPVEGKPGAYYVSQVVINAHGEVLGFYHRTHPESAVYKAMYTSGGLVDFEYVAGDDFPVFDLGWGKVGVSICSEMFVPEVARIMALKGAEILLMPVGWFLDDFGWKDVWQTLVRARAIENIMYTASCQNLFDRELMEHYSGRKIPAGDSKGLNRGLGIVAGPEGVLGVMPNEGILYADLDMKRLRAMRKTPEFPDGLEIPAPFGSVPGVLGLRRPELTREPMLKEAHDLPDLNWYRSQQST
ncbi:carbon-nitrogen hydrolase family protein [Ruegeria sp. EL01]|uniref:carbon-nitrogen hydrolase family protein n=1 Tax=Ruegeria sp. EL01 TaxID=2107578 RepID=UPI000EA80429|nr:carbon-nitrogen hydrolase family protein [Ruegeria sp. EL01]